MLLSEGQMNDYKGAALILDALPLARQLLTAKSYDADWWLSSMSPEPGLLSRNIRRPVIAVLNMILDILEDVQAGFDRADRSVFEDIHRDGIPQAVEIIDQFAPRSGEIELISAPILRMWLPLQ